jgi:hypothetical protein
LPWVKVLPSSAAEHRCEGIKWSKASLRDGRAYRQEGLSALPERAKCKRRGWFRFTALTARGAIGQGTAKSGVYCYDHLAMLISYHDREHDRLRHWLEQNAPDWL